MLNFILGFVFMLISIALNLNGEYVPSAIVALSAIVLLWSALKKEIGL